MDCKDVKENLYKYLDGELKESLVSQVDSHLKKCPLCSLEMEKEDQFNKLVKNHMVKEEAPFELCERVIKNLEKPTWQERLRNVFLVPKVSFTATVIVAVMTVLIIGIINRGGESSSVFAASVHSHMDHLKGGYPLEIKTNNIEEAMAWFEGKMDFAIQRPHVALDQVDFLGARIVHLNNKKAALFVFEKNGHKVSAIFTDLRGSEFLAEKPNTIKESNEVGLYVKNHKGYNSFLCFHKLPKTGCIIVSDLPEDELIKIIA